VRPKFRPFCRFLRFQTKKRAIVCLVTDLFDSSAKDAHSPEQTAAYLKRLEKPIRAISARHDLIIVEVTDPAEQELPNVGLLRVKDPETQKVALIDTSDAQVRKKYAARMQQERRLIRENLTRLGAEHVVVSTKEDTGLALVKFLKRRASRA